ncbi:MAG: hypothetical protein C0608_08305 [Deltaproteobacteria bacterium]|nr:MAG: hypothetical protein C0608_08305 [Deltaproteobacteria bacterium]
MNTIVRIMESSGAFRIVRARDNRPLFGDIKFTGIKEARDYLTRANSRSQSSSWTEAPTTKKRESRFKQLSLFA